MEKLKQNGRLANTWKGNIITPVISFHLGDTGGTGDPEFISVDCTH